MDGTYEVCRKDEVVGRCSVTREGLYYSFHCLCRVLDGEIHRLWICCGDRTVDLGVLAPMQGGFGLRKKLPVKLFSGDEPKFYAQVREPGREKFIPVYPEEPFSYLTRIKDSYFAQRDGKAGIVLNE